MTSSKQPALPFRRILMTGGTGFVGRYLAPMLQAASPGARRLMLSRPGVSDACAGWDSASAEIFDRDAIGALVHQFQPDLVVHMAAQASVGQSHDASEATWRINFGGAFVLAQAVATYAPEATFHFTSSAEVYGLSLNSGPVTEAAPLLPQNCYARSKMAAEMMLGDVLPRSQRLIVTRAFNHVGAGQDERFVMASLAAQIVRIETGLQPPVLKVGNLEAARDFLDVRDVCRAYMEILSISDRLAPRSVFNISSGSATKVRDALAQMQGISIANFDIEVDQARLRPNDIPCAVGINDTLVSATGWRPEWSLKDSLQALMDGARHSARIRTGSGNSAL